MGMSVAASSAIIFTGFLVVASVLLTSINTTLLDSENNFKLAANRQTNQADTMLQFNNATKNATVLFINITNLGSNVLDVRDLQVLVNGSLVTDKVKKHSVSGITTTNLWGPNERLYLELNLKPAVGQRVKVVVGTGISANGKVT